MSPGGRPRREKANTRLKSSSCRRHWREEFRSYQTSSRPLQKSPYIFDRMSFSVFSAVRRWHVWGMLELVP
jgi:hypothetical protein